MTVGPYADSSTILLTPDFDSLTLADKRQKQRVQTSTPADLHFAADTAGFRCELADFSELMLRLNVRNASEIMPDMATEAVVMVDFQMGDVANSYRIRGKVFRRADDFCVIKLEQIYRNGTFEKIKMMDIIEIKTGLLNPDS
jgi:hypothetical protein